ncbi:S41 family peptidase [Flavobacterium azooxidireducens]|uniref:S41 family peptidase n=1 Tax=Flavobacterium azooxidireducens TaxID=1871076 RepID=A0ABY4KND1_9FLAO|nr:S41 family peptidase [Flavobacterium azooxidireducens]UPQ80752.1 S41 family peptidase [Flavobacterium azooxidireducens]
MKRIDLVVFFFILSYSLFSQNSAFNFDFEQNTIDPWKCNNENQKYHFDSSIKKNGNQSLLLENTAFVGMQGISNRIKGSFIGDSISFTIQIKTENVNEAYPFMVVGTKEVQKFFQMATPLQGTNDWTKVEIKLPYTSDCDNINLAVNFDGGKIWIDNVEVKINGQDIEKLNPVSLITQERQTSEFKLKSSLTQKQIENLYVLGKIWGYLKYYCPEITKNSENWDNELFDNLSIIYSENFESSLLSWLSKFEIMETTDYQLNNLKFEQEGNLDWINKKVKNKDLKDLLLKFSNAKRTNFQYTIEKTQYSGLNFKNEHHYSDMMYNDDGIKLLSIFRYWNLVEYWYPYKKLISKNWDDVLLKYIPKILETKSQLDYALCLNELIVETEDSHSIIKEDPVLTGFFGEYTIPVKVKFIDKKLVVTEINHNSTFRKGDIILSIDKESIMSLEKKLFKYSIASNEITTKRNLSKKIIRTSNFESNVQILRNGKKINLNSTNINAFSYNQPLKYSYEVNEEIGYLNAETAVKKDIDSLMNKWNNKKAIIVDLRNYPKENLTFLLSPYLHNKEFVGFQMTEAKFDYPGYFTKKEAYFLKEFKSPKFNGKLFVLVDENTQSKAEFNAMALKVYPNTIIIGSQTAGTDGAASMFYLPGNYSAFMTTEGIYNPDWSQSQKIGIKPDIKVSSTLKSISENEDLLLNKAIEMTKN